MTIAERLEEQMKQSEEFSERNFGLMLGSDFAEIARECLTSNKVCQQLLMQYIRDALGGDGVAKHVAQSRGSITELVASEPAVFKGPLTWMYWGIQLGRQLEKESIEALRAIEEAQP